MTPTNDPSPAAPPLPVDDLPLLTEVVDTPTPASASPVQDITSAAEAQLRWIEHRLPQLLAEEMTLLQARVLTRLRIELERKPPTPK